MSSSRDPVPTAVAWIVAGASAGYLAVLSRRRRAERELEAPEAVPGAVPDDDVAEPTDMRRATWKFAFTKALRGFSRDQCTDLAAALTYYSVLALFPALIALVSLLGVVGQGASTVDAVLDIAGDFVPAATLDTIEPVVTSMTETPAAGLGLLVGLLGALWSASGYVGAFGRAMNRIYDVEEGRPIWKLRPTMLLVTLVAVVLCAVAGLSLVLTGPVAQSVGDVVGLGDTAVQVWGIAKWPVLLLIVMAIVAILYYATPNVQQPRFRWVSIGAAVAVVTWILASALFGLYVSMAGNYNATYGSLASIIVFLLWLWITNIALLLGAELDAEIERSRELQAGMAAEEDILLPPRDTRGIDKQAEKDREEVAQARALREQHEDADA
ncbi:YihY/virulence factor BrkB family protein [Aeromicrobium sp. CF4.19]|uniref:YihY/virulence factor BrkB family protein n=1 Tax=Aeromicrobium sp. CF4.19 TaxID=3373082 RepID=UPI003EE4A5ED